VLLQFGFQMAAWHMLSAQPWYAHRACTSCVCVYVCMYVCRMRVSVSIYSLTHFHCTVCAAHRFTPLQPDPLSKNHVCWENTTLFTFSNYQYIALALAFNFKDGFRKGPHTNSMCCYICAVLCVVCCLLCVCVFCLRCVVSLNLA